VIVFLGLVHDLSYSIKGCYCWINLNFSNDIIDIFWVHWSILYRKL